MASKKKETSGKGSRVQFDETFDATMGGTSSSKGVVRVGFRVPEKQFPFSKVRKYFAAAALTLRIQHDPQAEGDAKGQGTLIETVEHDVTFDCKTSQLRYSSTTGWTVQVQLMLKDAPIDELAAMSEALVQMSIKYTGKNAEPTPEPEEEAEPDESAGA